MKNERIRVMESILFPLFAKKSYLQFSFGINFLLVKTEEYSVSKLVNYRKIAHNSDFPSSEKEFRHHPTHLHYIHYSISLTHPYPDQSDLSKYFSALG
jgi:hypothetical protein